ncbi:hypothetical protein J6590_102714, partial [Homalodisca vitripennis]
MSTANERLRASRRGAPTPPPSTTTHTHTRHLSLDSSLLIHPPGVMRRGKAVCLMSVASCRLALDCYLTVPAIKAKGQLIKLWGLKYSPASTLNSY